MFFNENKRQYITCCDLEDDMIFVSNPEEIKQIKRNALESFIEGRCFYRIIPGTVGLITIDLSNGRFLRKSATSDTILADSPENALLTVYSFFSSNQKKVFSGYKICDHGILLAIGYKKQYLIENDYVFTDIITADTLEVCWQKFVELQEDFFRASGSDDVWYYGYKYTPNNIALIIRISTEESDLESCGCVDDVNDIVDMGNDWISNASSPTFCGTKKISDSCTEFVICCDELALIRDGYKIIPDFSLHDINMYY